MLVRAADKAGSRAARLCCERRARHGEMTATVHGPEADSFFVQLAAAFREPNTKFGSKLLFQYLWLPIQSVSEVKMAFKMDLTQVYRDAHSVILQNSIYYANAVRKLT